MQAHIEGALYARVAFTALLVSAIVAIAPASLMEFPINFFQNSNSPLKLLLESLCTPSAYRLIALFT